MLAAIDGAKSRINFETYVYNDGEIGDRFVDALARAAERGVVVRIVIDPVGSSLKPKNRERLKAAGAQAGLVQSARLLHHRRLQLPDPSQDAGRRWRRRVHRRHGHRGSMARPRAGQGTLARHAVPAHRPRGPRARGVVLRELDRNGRPVGAGARSANCRRARPARARSWCGAIRCPAPATSSCIYLLAIGAARKTIDIQSPYITLDPSTQWSLDEARKRGVRIRMLTEGDITDAMPVKHASRYDYQTACSMRASKSSNTSRR